MRHRTQAPHFTGMQKLDVFLLPVRVQNAHAENVLSFLQMEHLKGD